MKKITVFSWLVLAMVLSALVLMGCQEDSKKDPQKQITITDIPSEHNGRYGSFALGTLNGEDLIAASHPTLISGGVVSAKLFNYDNNDYYGKEFTGHGNFMLIFLITDYTGNTLYWSGGAPSVNV